MRYVLPTPGQVLLARLRPSLRSAVECVVIAAALAVPLALEVFLRP